MMLKKREVAIKEKALEAEVKKTAEARKYAAQQEADARLYETQKAAALKFEPSAIRLFIEAFFCGVLMFTAVNSKKTIITIFCIMTFILLGYEHCVADFPFLYFALSFENIIKFLSIILGNTIGSIFIHFLVKEKENGKKKL